MKGPWLLLALALPALLTAQEARPQENAPQDRRREERPVTPPYQDPAPVKINSAFLNALTPRELGPTSMGGRIMDLAVYEKEPRIFYVATASGGLFKTTSGGITFTPVFDREGMIALGAAAVGHHSPDLVWVGTGEGSSRNSTSWGDGVYKSTDGGKTWTNMGLKGSHHITRILIHPKNPDIVYVAALGRLWGASDERGVYKTTDGGKSWTKVLYVNDLTGPAELTMDPSNPDILLAGMWQRRRWAYRWESGGPGSALYRTTNGGRNWAKVTKGIPDVTLGRIGLSVMRKDPRIVVATIEAGDKKGGTFRSTDRGASWTKVNDLNPRPFYFSQPKQDPVDPDKVFILGVQLHLSNDAGKTFRVVANSVHSDHHAMWIDPTNPNHVIDGNDGGVAESFDGGTTWRHLNNMPLGQFYAISYDMRKPYWVYGGLQDNGTWGGPTQSSEGTVRAEDFNFLLGGDGFYTANDPEDWRWFYGESQGGFINRVNQLTGASRPIRPRIEGEQLRFNWSTPFFISPHNPRTLYLGANRLFKTVNRGDRWDPISPDLSTNDPEKQKPAGGVTPENTGAERHCTITTVAESRRKPGLLWVGTDDGLIHVTQNDGASWTNVTANLPEVPAHTWVSRVEPSKFVEGRCYVTLDGHRNNDFNPYVFVTEDFGKTWQPIASGLPINASCHVIREGNRNANLLLLGTELGLYVSTDRGRSWLKYNAGTFPNVPVHDLHLHPREDDAILGTHGRSIWLFSAAPLEQLKSEAMGAEPYLFEPQTIYQVMRTSSMWFGGDAEYRSVNTQPGVTVFYRLPSEAKEVKIAVQDITGRQLFEIDGTKTAGLNGVRLATTGRRNVSPGRYRLTLKVDGKELTAPLNVELSTGLEGSESGPSEQPEEIER